MYTMQWLLWPTVVAAFLTLAVVVLTKKKRSNYTNRGQATCASKGLLNSFRGCISAAFCENNVNGQNTNGTCTCGPGYQWDGLNKVCFINLPWTTEQNIAICQSKGMMWKNAKFQPRERGRCVARANVPMR
jgi:hypothetical protein